MDLSIIARRIKETQRFFPNPSSEDRMKWYEGVFAKYQAIPLKLPITDDSMSRVCQVLTDHDYVTTESCEGHGRTLPKIFFKCDDQDKMRDLTHIVNRGLDLVNFPWQITTWTSDPYLNPESGLRYILQPENLGKIINPKTEHQKLLEDLDFIGIETLSYFNIPWRFKKVDKDLKKLWSKCYNKKED